MNDWINVEDLMPDPYQQVIVAMPWALDTKLHVESGWLRDSGMWTVNGHNTRKVKYWMPMPAPPEEETK